jgi:urate oxidase
MNTAYGKSRVRLMQVTRGDNPLARKDSLCDLTVAIRFEGDYDESYTAGDNGGVLPTDTMKNTVYALAAPRPIADPETFGLTLARHFLGRNPRLEVVTIDLTQHAWAGIETAGNPAGSDASSHHPREDGHAFMRRGPETRTARVVANRREIAVDGGIADLLILKSAKSAFAGFMRDELTTLPETRDRLFATSLTATWRYRSADVAFGPAWQLVRETLLGSFAAHDSLSVQHTLYAMGQAVIARVNDVDSIHLTMPNKHHLPIDLSRFGLENKNEIFVPTDEPHGLIEATIVRE